MRTDRSQGRALLQILQKPKQTAQPAVRKGVQPAAAQAPKPAAQAPVKSGLAVVLTSRMVLAAD